MDGTSCVFLNQRRAKMDEHLTGFDRKRALTFISGFEIPFGLLLLQPLRWLTLNCRVSIGGSAPLAMSVNDVIDGKWIARRCQISTWWLFASWISIPTAGGQTRRSFPPSNHLPIHLAIHPLPFHSPPPLFIRSIQLDYPPPDDYSSYSYFWIWRQSAGQRVMSLTLILAQKRKDNDAGCWVASYSAWFLFPELNRVARRWFPLNAFNSLCASLCVFGVFFTR